MYNGPPHYGHRWKRAFQHSLMSTVPVKVILMGFNLLLGARGNILMRQSLCRTLIIRAVHIDAILLLPVWNYWSPLLSFATLHVLFGEVWRSSWSIIHTDTHASAHSLITIFHIHFTRYAVFIGNYRVFIAYLWMAGHLNHLAKGMNIKFQRTAAQVHWQRHVCLCLAIHVVFFSLHECSCVFDKCFKPEVVSPMNLWLFLKITNCMLMS